MKSGSDQLGLSAGLTAKTQQLCLGLESGAADVREWQAKGAHLAELLEYARLRPLAEASLQQRLL